MRSCFAFLSIFILTLNAYSQSRNNIWCFGDSAGIDFNSSIPASIVTISDSRGSCSAIADSSGSLVLYSAYDRDVQIAGTDPVKIYSSNHAIMQNGDSIKGGGWYRELIITDKPGDSNEYYLFNIGVTLDYGFYYSIVDMSQNGGLGAVVQKNVQLQNFKCTDGLAAVKHGNGRDWWVIFRRWDFVNDIFYKYLVTDGGISSVIQQSIGSATDNGFTKMIFAPGGDRFCMINYYGLMELYDFDRCTGAITNPVTMHPEPTTGNYLHFWSCEFSPNGRFLYVTAYDDTCYLYQYDLLSSNPASTRITLDTITNDLIGIGNLKLAPDGKIYLTHAWECTAFPYCYPYPDSVYNAVNMNLSVINYPDSLGAACGYAPFSFYLGGHRTYYGLPNNPDYDLGPLVGSGCDTLTWTGNSQQPLANRGLMLTYAPDWQKLFVNAQGLKGRNCHLQILDINGKLIFSSSKQTTPPYFTQDVHLPGLAGGMYVVRLVTEKEQLGGKFIKQ